MFIWSSLFDALLHELHEPSMLALSVSCVFRRFRRFHGTSWLLSTFSDNEASTLLKCFGHCPECKKTIRSECTNASWKLTKSHKEHRSQLGRAVDIAHVAATKRPASSVPVLAISFKTWRLWPVLQVWDDFDWMAACSQGCGTPVPFGKLTYEDLNWSFRTCFSVENIQTLKRDNLSKDAVMIQIDLLQFQSMRFADMHCCQGTRGQLCSRPAQTQKVFDRRGYPWLAHGQFVQTE